MSLPDDGFRFVRRDGIWSWMHPNLVRPTDFDATDMSDEEFERMIEAEVCAQIRAESAVTQSEKPDA